MAAPGVVYTRGWVVDLILDLVGYTSDIDLTAGCIVEPACGEGAFLARIVDRLCISAISKGKFEPDVLEKCVRAFDIDPKALIVVSETMRTTEPRRLLAAPRMWTTQRITICLSRTIFLPILDTCF